MSEFEEHVGCKAAHMLLKSRNFPRPQRIYKKIS